MPRTRDEGQVARAAGLYHSAGLTEAEVARVMQVSERTVRRWLAGTARRTGPRGRTDVSDEKVAGLKDREGLSYEETARRTGMSKTGARMRHYAITGRPRPGRVPRHEEPAGNEETGET